MLHGLSRMSTSQAFLVIKSSSRKVIHISRNIHTFRRVFHFAILEDEYTKSLLHEDDTGDVGTYD